MGLRPDIPCKKHKNGSIELYATIANTKRECAYFDTPSLEYEDMLSDKLRGAHPDPFPSKARLPVAFPKRRGPCPFVLLSHVFLSFCLIMRGGAHPDPPKGRGPCSFVLLSDNGGWSRVLLSFCLMPFCPSV